MDNKKFIYILNNGLSGSTIFQRHLSSNNVRSLGELRTSFYKKPFCNCGKNLKNCKYWKNSYKPEFSYFENIIKEIQRFSLYNIIAIIFFPNLLVNKYKNFSDVYSNFIKDILTKNDYEYFIDSSKSLFLLNLINIEDINLKVIHLYKNPISMVLSHNNHSKKINLKVLRKSVRYLLENFLMTVVAKRFDKKYILINYEKLIINNSEKLNRLFNRKIYFSDEKITINNHDLAGNKLNFNKKKIKLDLRYKKVKFIYKLIIFSINFPILIYFKIKSLKDD